jgi:hypothetical protein
MLRFWIPGPLPGLNEVLASAKGYGGRGFGYAKLKRRWTQTIALHVLAAGIKHVDRAHFEFRWVEKDQRRDPDGVAAGGRKVLFDGLVLAKVLANDGWKQVAGWTDSFEVGAKPGVEVTIIPVP